MGFARTLNALLSHLPKSRQTLLFSATQTDSVKDLARLSLNDPVYVGVKEEGSQTATPKSLEQHYVVVSLDETLDILWISLKAHLQSKILVFMPSGKQVRETIGGWAILKVSLFQQVSFIFETSGKTPTRYSPASPSRKAEAGDAISYVYTLHIN